MNDDYTIEVVWYPNADARPEDFCVDDTEDELIQLRRFPNDADPAEE